MWLGLIDSTSTTAAAAASEEVIETEVSVVWLNERGDEGIGGRVGRELKGDEEANG